MESIIGSGQDEGALLSSAALDTLTNRFSLWYRDADRSGAQRAQLLARAARK